MLGKTLGSSPGKAGDIQQTLDNLSADWSKLDRLWTSRKQRLEQEVELQRLNQEGDRIEAALSGHEARLKVQDVGVSMFNLTTINTVQVLIPWLLHQDSVDSVHSLLGRQEELEGLLKALDQRVDVFSARSQELIDQQHYAAKQ